MAFIGYISGKLISDPRPLQSNGDQNETRVSITVADQRSRLDKDTREYVGKDLILSLIATGKTAEFVLKHLKTGAYVEVNYNQTNHNEEYEGRTIYGYRFWVNSLKAPYFGPKKDEIDDHPPSDDFGGMR
jgi:hypothetical protein